MRRGEVLLGLSFLLSKILGLLRDNLLASKFGASTGDGVFNLDAYYAAFRLPDFIFNLLSYGVLSAAFLPIFVEILKKEDREAAFKFAHEILRTIGTIVAGLSIMLFIAAPFFMKFIVPGFSEEALEVAVNATRIMLITPLFFTISAVLSGIQNSFHRYLGIALAPIIYNIGIVGGVILLAPRFGIYGVSIGVAVGAFLNMLVLLTANLRTGFSIKWPADFWTQRVKEMITLALPRVLGMSVTQLSLIVDTIIASTLATGSIAIINFSSNLESLPIGIVGISVAVVSFSTLAGFAAEKNLNAFINEVRINFRRLLFLLIPLTIGMFMLRLQIVRLLLGYGKFTEADIAITSTTLGIFLSGLIFTATIFLLGRAFYSLKDTKTPVIVSIIAITINVAASLLLTKIIHLNTFGLAAANSLADIINASILCVLLSRKLNAKVFEGMEVFKSAVAGLIMAGVLYLAIPLITNTLAQLAVGIIIGAGVYFALCKMLKCKTITLIK